MIGRLFVNGAYFLQKNKKYQKTKRFFYNLLESNGNKYKKHFDAFMITLIFISVVILIRDVKNDIHENLQFFNNYIISIIFLIEYILRLWVSSSVSAIVIKQSEHDIMLGRKFQFLHALWKVTKIKFKYILSFKAIVDLLAIVPFFHQLRLLRIFILFRVFKLFRYARSFQAFISILGSKKFEFLTLLMFSSIVILVSSILIYVMEANNPDSPINTLFEAFYWSIVTISTVGYGDITPVSDLGRFVAILVITAGIAVLAFTTSLVVSAFTEKLDEIKENKLIEDVSKLKQFYLICGYENVAIEVAKKLQLEHDVIVLDEDIQRVSNAKKDGLIALNFDPGKVESYKKFHIDIDTQVKAILCLRESDIENVYTILTVRSFNKNVFILSILLDSINKNKLAFAGASEILYAKELVGMIAREFIGQPVAFEVIHALRSENTYIDIEEILVSEKVSSNLVYVKNLNHLTFRIILLGIYKDESKEFLFNPLDDVLLSGGDYLLVVGNSAFIQEFEKSLYQKVSQ